MLEIRIDGDTVYLAGRFDASQIETAQAGFREIDRSVVMDLSELDYISSAGIGFVIATLKRLRDGGASLRLTRVKPRILTIFQLAGLDRVLEIE